MLALLEPKAQIRCSTMKVTPDIAREWLSKARATHKLDMRQAHAYASDMRDGSWRVNGEAIIFSSEGKLLDGRKRLTACTEADVAFHTLVVENVDDRHFETIDALRKRTLADILTIRKETAGRALGAALTVVWRYIHGELDRPKRSPTAEAILALLRDRPQIRESLEITRHLSPLLPPGLAGALHHLFWVVDGEGADKFFGALITPPANEEEGPVPLLRRTLRDLRQGGGTQKQSEVFAITVKAWNAYRKGTPIKLVRYVPQRESFPEIEDFPLPSSAAQLQGEMALDVDVLPNTDNPDLVAEVTVVTPAIALQLLQNNPDNRRAATLVIDKYARDILAGKWALNGQTIKVGRSGRLLDGQHRCRAAIKAGRDFPAIIVRNVDDDVFHTFDLGNRRSFAEVLQESGEQNAAALAAALRWLWLFENDLVQSRGMAPTNSELEQVLAAHPDIRRSIRAAMRMRDILAPGMGIALHYLFSGRDQHLADAFFDQLVSGEDLNRSVPVYHLRERLMKDRAARLVRLAEAERIALAIKAWNATKEGRQIQQLTWRNRGPSREPFPRIS